MNAEINIVVDADDDYAVEFEIRENAEGNRRFLVGLNLEGTYHGLGAGDVNPENGNVQAVMEQAFRVLENTFLDYLDTVAAELGITRSK